MSALGSCSCCHPVLEAKTLLLKSPHILNRGFGGYHWRKGCFLSPGSHSISKLPVKGQLAFLNTCKCLRSTASQSAKYSQGCKTDTYILWVTNICVVEIKAHSRERNSCLLKYIYSIIHGWRSYGPQRRSSAVF